MIVYSSLILICIFLHCFCKQNRNILFNLVIIVLFIISAFRYNVGTDYKHYGDIFQWILYGYNTYVEVGYKYLNLFVQDVLHMNQIGIYIISSLIIILCFGMSIKENVEKKYLFFSIFMFICSGIYFSSFNLIRQYIGIAILALGTRLLIKKSYLIYILLIVIAALFHTSAWIEILFVLIVIFFRDRKNSRLIWSIYIISILFMIIDIRYVIILVQKFIPSRWSWYMNSNFLLHRNLLSPEV